MRSANVAQAKNELSRLLRRVKRGETVVITERDHPIAQLQPYKAAGADVTALAPLFEAGVLAPPVAGPLDVAKFLAAPRPVLSDGQSLAAAVLTERGEGR